MSTVAHRIADRGIADRGIADRFEARRDRRV
jgi:hypothetical protein